MLANFLCLTKYLSIKNHIATNSMWNNYGSYHNGLIFKTRNSEIFHNLQSLLIFITSALIKMLFTVFPEMYFRGSIATQLYKLSLPATDKSYLTLFGMGFFMYAKRMGGGGVKITPTLTVEPKELQS